MVTRMCRLVLWKVDTWPDDAEIDWQETRTGGGALVDPFRLSPSIRFGFGGPRDTGALIRDATEYLGIEHRAHLGRLLGVSQKHRRHYRAVMDWYNGRRRCSPRYLLRLLGLLLWARAGYPIDDIWSVDWSTRTVEWQWDGQPTVAAPLPGNPFEWLELAGRPRRRRQRRLRSTPPLPVYAQPGYLAPEPVDA